MKNPKYDIIIAGGGLVGGSLALALRATGLRIAVIEAAPAEQRIASPLGERALALAYATRQILANIGIWQQVQVDAAPIRHIHVSDRGHFGKTRLDAEREQTDALGWVLVARILEERIATALDSADWVDLYCPARVAAQRTESDSIHVALQLGKEIHEISGRLLVGADGGQSNVRSLLGISQITHDYGQMALSAVIQTEKNGDNVAYERFTSNGPLAMLPLAKRRYSLVWTLKPNDAERLREANEDEFCEELHEQFGYWLGHLQLSSQRYCFPLKLIQTERLTAPRALLIGNAAHQLHPVAGQGFNLGLRDAAVLAEHLAVAQLAREDIGASLICERYARLREKDHINVIHFTNGLIHIFANDHKPLVWARNSGLTILNQIPILRSYLAHYAMGLSTRIPRI